MVTNDGILFNQVATFNAKHILSILLEAPFPCRVIDSGIVNLWARSKLEFELRSLAYRCWLLGHSLAPVTGLPLWAPQA